MAGVDVAKNRDVNLGLLNALSPLNPMAARFTWDYRRLRLREEMKSDDWSEFFDWPIVRESLHSGWTRVSTMQHEDIPPRLIDASRVGDLLTGTSIQQAWYLYQWETFSGQSVDDLDWIHEFGGGYGAMALLCRRLGYDRPYTIQDFAELHMLQEYFLSKHGIDDVESVGPAPLKISPDLYIALFSMSEVAPDERDIPNANNYLIGYQPEWGTWDNSKWFLNWRAGLGDKYRWRDYENPHFTNHRVLVGCIKSHI
jgi:hypothetical protein